MNQIEIYTDGACKGNPGPGGFGIVLKFAGKVKEDARGFRHTTNNRMELMAVIHALRTLKTKEIPVIIYSDSKYVIDSITKGWIFAWKKKNFVGRKNADLWMDYMVVQHGFTIQFQWVKGHNGHIENERCDFLASDIIEKGNLLIDQQFEQNNENR